MPILQIDRGMRQLNRLSSKTLSETDTAERRDLQQWIYNSPDCFFGEMNQPFFVVGQEVRPNDFVGDRIDLLGVDPDGTTVIVELKIGNNKFQLLQAISYAAMVSRLSPDELMSRIGESRREEFVDFLDTGGAEDLNRSQRIVLIAEEFDYEVLIAAEWLCESYDLEIACIRVSLAVDEVTEREYLAYEQIYPAREIEEHAVRRRSRATNAPGQRGLVADTLTRCSNEQVVKFFRTQIEAGIRANESQKALAFYAGGRKEWSVTAQLDKASVWQYRRFEGDVELWKGGLSCPEEVGEKYAGRSLAFRLVEERDFEFFIKVYRDRSACGDRKSAAWVAPEATAAH